MGAPPGDAGIVPFLSSRVAREGAARRLRHARGASAAPRGACLRGPAEALACRARATLSIDATDALAACPVPVLYLRARKDGVIPASRALEIQKARPSVEIVDIDGPHLALVTNPAAAWAALREFMDRVDAGTT